MSKRGVSALSLRARLRNKNFVGSSSNPDKMEGGAEVNQPPPRKKRIIFKKRKSNMINLDEEEKGIQLGELMSFTSKQERLHSFDDDGDGSSVWDKKFLFNVVTDEVVQASSNISRIEEVGDVGVDQFLQVLGFFLASIGPCQEKRHRKLLLKITEEIGRKGQLERKETALSELEKKLSSVEEELKLMKESHEKDMEALKKKEDKASKLNIQIVEVTLKMKEMENTREADILDAFVEGFEHAVTQAKFFAPDSDFSAMDPSKIIHDGQLVDDEEVAEEGDDNLTD